MAATSNTDSPPPPLTLQQQYNAAFAAGIAITSTSTPALNGTYPIDGAAQAYIIQNTVYILVNKSFVNGTNTMEIPDINGAPHTFTAAQYLAYGTALAQYVYALFVQLQTAEGGGAPTWPSNQVTIL